MRNFLAILGVMTIITFGIYRMAPVQILHGILRIVN